MRRCALLVLVVVPVVASVVLACGGPVATRRAELPPEDAAVSLAAMLPARADRCLVARPGLLADRRRSLILHATDGEVLAWSGTPRVAAYASARAIAEDGSVARVTIVRLAEPVSGAREALRDLLPLRVRFEDEPCHADECRLPIAEILDAVTIRIARGDVARTEGGSQCLDLAISHPRAIEISVLDRSCGPTESGACVERRIMDAGADGIRVRQQLVMRDEARARELVAALAQHEGPGASVEQRGATVIRVAEQSWDELQLVLEDERIDRAAIERRAGARRRVPVERVDVSRLAVVRQQVRLREEALARARGDEARGWAADELMRLLARAVGAHPDETDLAIRLIRLLLDDLRSPAAAALAADRAIAHGVDRPAFELLRREALVASAAHAPDDEASLAAAAAALVAASIAEDEASARLAVRDLAAVKAAGIAYEVAEPTWAHAREVLAAETPLSAPPRGSAIPLAALPATLAWLAAIEGISGPFSAFVAVRGSAADMVRAQRVDRMEAAFVMRLDGLGERSVFAGHAASDDALLRLGASLESALVPGPVTIDVSLVSLASSARLDARLVGELGNGRVRIDRADARSASRAWPRIERYLGEPLRVLGSRLFPPPDLVVIAADEEDAQRLARAADGQGDARCTARGVEVRCAPRSDRAPFEALRAIARLTLTSSPPRAR